MDNLAHFKRKFKKKKRRCVLHRSANTQRLKQSDSLEP